MASKVWRRRRGPVDDGVTSHVVGNATVVHADDEISAEAQSLALSVVADPRNDVVVLDLGDGLPIGLWESVAGTLPRRRRGIRLVACGRHPGAAVMAGQWLSERLNRTVVAPDGDLIRGAAGALFVHSAPHSGWVRFRPGHPPRWDGKRYPAPAWDTAATEQRVSSSTGEIEPLPGGVWIHDVREPDVVAGHRRRLTADLPCQPETMTVLLGCPGTAPLSLDDVVRFWRDLDPESRERIRFVQYGDVRLPDGETFGQALADLVGANVVCYTGLPVGSPNRWRLLTVRPDGDLGWPAYAIELRYAPRAHPHSKALRPYVLSHRAPLDWSEEVAPRVYWYAPDAVVEVVEAGLWIRPPQEPVNAERIRGASLDPERHTLVFDDTVEARSGRMRDLAADLMARLAADTARHSGLVAASVMAPGVRPAGAARASLAPSAEPEPAADAVEPPEPALAVLTEITTVSEPPVPAPAVSPVEPEPAAVAQAVATPHPVAAPTTLLPVIERRPPTTAEVRIQPVPSAAASAVRAGRPVAEERAWLRRTLSRDFDVMASSMSRIMSEHPAMPGADGVSADDVLADTVAIRLYLSRRGAAVDAGLRSGRNGPHVPVARCAVAGLSRLPSHRGPTVYTTTPSPQEWELYRNRRLITEWGFLTTLAEPCAAQTGTVDVLIWSMTARRTALVEPDGDERVTDRVLFAPGTNFKILDTAEPGDGRGVILLREIGSNEIDDDGRVDPHRTSLDDLAVLSLQRSRERWAGEEPRRRTGPGAADRFGLLPGVVRRSAGPEEGDA